MSRDDRLRVEDADGVRRLVLDRPEARNALDGALAAALAEAIAAAGADPSVRVVVLAGAGAGFSAGADLKETARISDPAAAAAHAHRMRLLLDAPGEIDKPVIAQVHGFALGAGCALALACDVVVCTADARLGFPEMRHAVVPALVVPGIVQRAGPLLAFDLLANGRIFTATEAAIPGLVVLPAGTDAASDVARRAAELAAHPPELLAAVKRMVRTSDRSDQASAMDAAEQVNVENRLRRARTTRQDGE
ncbi:enoyl-CoA hydratase/isomerase family protein [Xanthobacter tagetidis]|nr:enoyl-CoA hydratase/isomerase family protein [Xanthobacter tagetidis]MBB6307393.1 enoyl-CoA hydratase/carnithine racemase [Xanthobacter tagetidis]